ncbi:hypothetical protein ScPMuIL_001057 [Solemya velum]
MGQVPTLDSIDLLGINESEKYTYWTHYTLGLEGLPRSRFELQQATTAAQNSLPQTTAAQNPLPQTRSVLPRTRPYLPPPRAIPRTVTQMTVDNPSLSARVQTPQKMNFDFPFDDNCMIDAANTDHTLPSEFGAMDMLMYASSPNSLHMYDQERADMNLSFCGMNTPSSSTPISTATTSDDFELKAQYENSREILPHDTNLTTTSVKSSSTQSLCSMSNMEATNTSDDFSLLKGVEGPTLAELNFSESLMDDIVSIINNDAKGSDNTTLSNESAQIPEPVPNTKMFNTLEKPIFTTGASTSSIHQLLCAPSNSTVSHLQKAVSDSSRKMLEDITTVSLKNRHHSMPESFGHGATDIVHKSMHNPQRTSTVTSVTAHLQSPTAQLSEMMDFQRQVPKESSEQSLVGQLLTSPRKRTASSAGLIPRNTESVDQKWEEIKQLLKPPSPIPEQEALPTPTPTPTPTLIPMPMVTRNVKRERYDSGSSVFTDVDSLNTMSDSDSDDDDNYSDAESINSQDSSGAELGESFIGSNKEKQYFWQYNVQSKGPKGTRLHFSLGSDDPHVSQSFEDPVFDQNVMGVTIRHGGKARKGDGNDILPNPSKLHQLGLQLKRLNRQISEFVPLVELPVPERNKSKKEKNKLASRACRLKKKAQHEANKVKLYGLNQEHRQLMSVIKEIRTHLFSKVDNPNMEQELSSHLEELIREKDIQMIAGNTTDFVNTVIKRVKEGDSKGGLDFHKRK